METTTRIEAPLPPRKGLPQDTRFRPGVHGILAVLLVLVFLATRLPDLPGPMDGDETFGIRLCEKDYPGLIAAAAEDISHPPLFFALTKAWHDLGGRAAWWLHLLPLLLSLGSLAAFFLLCRELRLTGPAVLLALAYQAVNFFVLTFATYLRLFILLQMMSLFSLWAFVRFCKEPVSTRKTWWPLIGINLILVYSHYWGWIWLATQGLYLLIAQPRRVVSFTLHGLILLAGFAPWAWVVYQAAQAKGTLVSQISWIAPPDAFELIYFYAMLDGLAPLPHTTLVGLALFLGVGLAGWVLGRDMPETSLPPQPRVWLLLTLTAFVPVLVTFLLSHLAPQSVWAERQLIISAVPYWLLVAIGIWRFPWPIARTVLTALTLAWALGSAYEPLFVRQRRLNWPSLVHRLHAARLETHGPDLVQTREFFIEWALSYHLEQEGIPDLRAVQTPELNDMTGDAFWFAYRDTTWKEDLSPQEYWKARGYLVSEPLRIRQVTQTVYVVLLRKRFPL